MNSIQTTHILSFESAESPYDISGNGHKLFRVGTCEGQWGCTEDSYYILSVANNEPGNGHLQDVFQWFEYSCKRDGKNLLVLECMNDRFYNHLLSKRGFIRLDSDGENCIKVFNRKGYKRLLRDGNEILSKGTLKCI